jgi:hypothetical protein
VLIDCLKAKIKNKGKSQRNQHVLLGKNQTSLVLVSQELFVTFSFTIIFLFIAHITCVYHEQ